MRPGESPERGEEGGQGLACNDHATAVGALVPRSTLVSQTVPSNISQVKADSAWSIATGYGQTLGRRFST